MTDTPRDEAGTVVTYLDTSESEHGEFRTGVVTGAGVSDPDTGAIWVPIVRPDAELTLVDPALIMDPESRVGPGDPAAALDVLAGALGTLALELHDLDEDEPLALRVARNMLDRFAREVRPVENALGMLVDADPNGGLSIVLTCIGSAADELEDGDVTGGKMGILVANAAMAELIE
jgi:hypothetical protein